MGCLKNKLFLFHHLHVEAEDCVLPPPWWKPHEIQFPNIFNFVALTFFELLGTWIETK